MLSSREPGSVDGRVTGRACVNPDCHPGDTHPPTLMLWSGIWLRTMETSLVDLFRDEIYWKDVTLLLASKKAETQLRQEPGQAL